MAGNDFESPVFEHRPEVREAFEALAGTHPLVCRMTGSGSTLFAVWTQGRDAFADAPGAGGTWENLRGIFHQRAENTFLIKVSYWFDR